MTEIRFTPDGISSSFQVNVTSSNFAIGSSDNVASELQFVNILENTSAFKKVVVVDDFDRAFFTDNLILNNISASSADINDITSSYISASGFISASTLYVKNSAFFENGLTGSITGSTAIFNQGIFNAITSSAISTSYIDLDPILDVNAPPHREGRIYYNTEEGALTVYNNEEDISLQVGQEFYIRVRNETGVPIQDGTPVKISGSQGDTPLAHLAVSEDITQFYANPDSRELFQNHIIGLATHRIEHNTTGYVTELGIVRGVDTTNFQAGDELYVSSSAGELTNIPPSFPYEIIQVGTVVRSANNGFVFVNIKEPVNFGNISGYSGSYEAHLGELWVYQPNGAWTHTRYVPQITSSILSASNIYATNIFDINSESGSTGQILSSTPTGIDWVDISGISGSIIGSGTTNYLSKWKSSSELTRSVVYEDTNGNLGVGITTPTHVIEVSSSNQNLLNLNDVLYVSGSHLNGTGSGLVNIGTDKDLDVTVNIGKNIASNAGSAILNLYSYYSPEIHLSAHNNWSNWTIEGGVNKDLKIYDQGANRRDVVAIGTLTYPTTLVMTKTDPCFEVEIAGGNLRSLSIGQTFVGNTQRYDTHLRTSNGAATYESFLFKHSGEIVASGSFIGSNVDVSGSTSNFHGDVKITGSLYLTGSLYDVNENAGNVQSILSSTGDSIEWIDATSIDGFISGSGTANYLSKWKSSSELTRSVIYEDVNGNIGIGTTSPSELFNIVGNSLLEGDLTVTGQSIFLSASYINLTSSNVNIGDNILTLNAFSPFKRYAGIEMNDSGSSAVAQFLWDSKLDYFFISGSTATNSQNLVIVGPDSNESLSTGYLTLATDINQLSSSVISQNNDGNIGIGTPNPTHSLDVVGGIKTDQIYDKNNTSGSDGQLLSSTTDGVDWIDATDIDGFISGSGTTNYIPIWKSTSELSSSNIYQLNGNVGIGTNIPDTALHVVGDLTFDGNASRDILFGDNLGAALEFKEGTNPYIRIITTNGGEKIELYKTTTISADVTTLNLTVFGNISASGDLYLDGGIYDTNNEIGTSGQLLSSTGTATDWIDATEVDGFISGSGTTNYIPIWKSSSELSSSLIYQSNGNVGIGVVGAIGKLHIQDTRDGDVITRIKNLSAGSGARSGLRIEDASGVGGNILVNHPNYTGVSLWNNAMVISGDSALNNGIFVFDSDIIHLGNSLGGDLHISSSKVGIGTTTPEQKLHVNLGRIAVSDGYNIGDTDADTGMFTDLNNLYFQTANSTRATISSSGNFGIGTLTPDYKLDVVEDGGVASTRIRSTNANVARLFLSNTVGTWRLYSAAASNSFRIFSDSINDDTFVIDSSGNVGIGGITNPTHSLNVVGGIKTDQIYDKNNTSGSDGQILSSTTTGIDWIDTSEIDGFVSGSGTATYLPLWTDTNTLSSSIVFQKADGNIGVNTTTPAYELEVSGGFAATEKHFVVQDPTNPKKRLVHSSLEGPENAVYFRGISTKKVIELPEYWKWLVNSDTITVHLTPVKKYQKLYFSKYENNKIYINNSLFDKLRLNKLNYHYIIYAERKDVNKLKVYVTK